MPDIDPVKLKAETVALFNLNDDAFSFERQASMATVSALLIISYELRALRLSLEDICTPIETPSDGSN